MTADLRSRNFKILEAIILSYAESGSPIGSEFLLGRYPFGVSPATIRNVMADLEEQGLITHPHTSAGRVPTDRGYRYYIDLLMESDRIRPEEEEAIGSLGTEGDKNPEEILIEAARILSDLTQEAGVALVPQFAHGSFRRLELIYVEPMDLFGVLISSEGLVRHTRIGMNQPLPAQHLARLEEILNSALAGLSMPDACSVLESMQGAEELDLSGLAPLFQDEASVILEGASWILEAPEFQDIERTRRLMRGLEDRHDLVQLLQRDLATHGVKVHIGSENRGTALTDCSVVAASYRLGAGVTGAVGVVGPTRMRYPRMTSLVSRMAQRIGQVFQEKNR